MLFVTAGFLVADIIGLWLLLYGNFPFSRSLLIEYHAVVVLMVIFSAAYAALQASRKDSFNALAVIVFLSVLIIYNPFFPFLVITVHAIAANLIVALLFVYYAWGQHAVSTIRDTAPA